MYICKVLDKCVSTIKDDGLRGYSLLKLQRIDKFNMDSGEIIVAVDTLGCSVDEVVLVTVGANARFALRNTDIPVDAAIVGIVDNYNSK